VLLLSVVWAMVFKSTCDRGGERQVERCGRARSAVRKATTLTLGAMGIGRLLGSVAPQSETSNRTPGQQDPWTTGRLGRRGEAPSARSQAEHPGSGTPPVILAVIPPGPTAPNQTPLTRKPTRPDLARPDWTVESRRLAVIS
jgi:hypothetical protein